MQLVAEMERSILDKTLTIVAFLKNIARTTEHLFAPAILP
jgi:hypothetical protein